MTEWSSSTFWMIRWRIREEGVSCANHSTEKGLQILKEKAPFFVLGIARRGDKKRSKNKSREEGVSTRHTSACISILEECTRSMANHLFPNSK